MGNEVVLLFHKDLIYDNIDCYCQINFIGLGFYCKNDSVVVIRVCSNFIAKHPLYERGGHPLLLETTIDRLGDLEKHLVVL